MPAGPCSSARGTFPSPVPNDRATRWLYRTATARVVTTGEALREHLIRDNGSTRRAIDSVPTGIDAARFAPRRRAPRARARPAAATPLVGIVATLRSWKGHRYLIDAMRSCGTRTRTLSSSATARSARRSKRRWIELALRGRVTFAGQQDDVARWLGALDVFVLPSYANEGVPQALLQAMFAAIPCVTTDAGAIPEIARDGDTARVVPREDAQALAAAIDALLADRNAGARLAQRAREHVVPRFGLDLMLDRMERVFRTALAESAHG